MGHDGFTFIDPPRRRTDARNQAPVEAGSTRYAAPFIRPFSTAAARSSFSSTFAATNSSLSAWTSARVGGSLMVCEA